MVFSQKVLQLLRQEPQSWLRALGPCVSEERMLRFLQVLEGRTSRVTVVLEVRVVHCERLSADG